MAPPAVAIFDVNETLSDLSPLAARFEEVGAPRAAARHLVRGHAPRRHRARGERWLRGLPRRRPRRPRHGADGRARAAPAALRGRRPRPRRPSPRSRCTTTCRRDFGSCRRRAIRIATLTNGSASMARGLLERAGLDALVERNLDVSEAGRWKPAREPYLHACRELGVEPAERGPDRRSPLGRRTARGAPGCAGRGSTATASPTPRSSSRPTRASATCRRWCARSAPERRLSPERSRRRGPARRSRPRCGSGKHATWKPRGRQRAEVREPLDLRVGQVGLVRGPEDAGLVALERLLRPAGGAARPSPRRRSPSPARRARTASGWPPRSRAGRAPGRRARRSARRARCARGRCRARRARGRSRSSSASTSATSIALAVRLGGHVEHDAGPEEPLERQLVDRLRRLARGCASCSARARRRGSSCASRSG